MDGNSWFPAPPVDVTVGGTFDNHISDLDAAETKALTRVMARRRRATWKRML